MNLVKGMRNFLKVFWKIAKFFDAIMSEKFIQRCIHNITEEQHGFISGRSTITNLILYSNYISNVLCEI